MTSIMSGCSGVGVGVGVDVEVGVSEGVAVGVGVGGRVAVGGRESVEAAGGDAGVPPAAIWTAGAPGAVAQAARHKVKRTSNRERE
jgi:hypothetical protein